MDFQLNFSLDLENIYFLILCCRNSLYLFKMPENILMSIYMDFFFTSNAINIKYLILEELCVVLWITTQSLKKKILISYLKSSSFLEIEYISEIRHLDKITQNHIACINFQSQTSGVWNFNFIFLSTLRCFLSELLIFFF